MKLHPDTLVFFEELEANNTREWFADNKKRWEAIKNEFSKLTEKLIEAMTPLDASLGNLTPKQCIYRIYRDLRFSPDKRPYKCHISCFLPSGGNRKIAVPGYYLQIGRSDYGLANGCSLGGGIFCPPPQTLAVVRQEIFYNTEEFKSIINDPEYIKYYGTEFFTSHKLSRVPKGFPADWPDADLLKYCDYTTMHTTPANIVLSDELLPYSIEAFKASIPLNKFIQKAMYEIL